MNLLASSLAAQGSASTLTARIAVILLIAMHLLLPLDRGFPSVPVFGRPLSVAIVATVSVLLLLVIQSRGSVLSYFREPYCTVQSLYAVVLFVGALRAPSPPSALHWTTLYYCTWVVNYVIFRSVTRDRDATWFSRAVVGLGLAAAAVGILQSVAGIQLHAYDLWFESYFSGPPADYALATTRALGTMNNPVLYSLLIALVVPFALDIRNIPLRAIALFVLGFTLALTGSRTAVVIVVTAAAAFVVYRWAAVKAVPAVMLGLLLVGVSLDWVGRTGGESRLALLFERFHLTERSRAMLNATPEATRTALDRATPDGSSGIKNSELSAALGVSLRQGALIEGIREMRHEWRPVTWLIGRGTFTSTAVGQRLQPWYNTVDNIFLAVVYERGLIGLGLFVGAFVSIMWTTRRAALRTVHWYTPLTLAAAGLSFCWDAYSMFNILAVGSMALAMWHHDARSAS